MGCGVSCSSCVNRATMSLFGRNNNNDGESRAKLERKLYIAKESPEPEFDLSDCDLRQVPAGTYSICKVYRKEFVYLQNNKLQSLEGGGQVSDLFLIKILNLNSNKMSQLPIDIKCLVNLTELHVSDNLIRNIPECIKHMESLQILDFSNNKLRHLTPTLGKLKNLRNLNIKGNSDLQEICSELCHASKLVQIELDSHNYTHPPPEICTKGTEEIMKYLCKATGIEYSSPSPLDSEMFSIATSSSIQNPFMRSNGATWEDQEAAIIAQENRLHKAAKEQREKFLSQIVQNQQILDLEILKVHEAKETEKQNLLKAIQNDEKEIACLVTNFIQSEYLKPEVIQQQLAFEQTEHDRLLEITRQNYDNLKKSDVLRAMEMLIEEDYSIQNSKKSYTDALNNMKQNMLMQDLEGADKMEELLKAKDQSRTALVGQLLEDQDIQKALVASLLERTDTKSWSLNQEITLISSHLARLSIIEQEKKKLHIAYNYNELLHQRVQLINLLDDLFAQQNKRRQQLVETLKDMETESNRSSDFWLQSYQKLIDSAPKTLLDVSKSLDPVLANYLLQEGVIHCLPFLVKFLFSGQSLMSISSEKLKENGVTLTSDRESILRAIKLYVGAKSENHNYENPVFTEATAPPKEVVEEQRFTGVITNVQTESSVLESECVICMDAPCEVVLVPCGHMCCCRRCSPGAACPLCRARVERVLRVMLA